MSRLSGKEWLTNQSIKKSWLAVAVAVWAIPLILGHRTAIQSHADSRISLPLLFSARELLGKGPVISSKLKIYSIDDSTFAQLGTWVLGLEEWVKILQSIDVRQPKAIFVDAMWSRGDDITGSQGEWIKALSQIKAPVIVGSFVSPAPISYREPLDLNRPEYAVSQYLTPNQPAQLPAMSERLLGHPYGPAREIQKAVRHIGHLHYDGLGTIAPLMLVRPQTVIRHLAFYLPGELKFEDSRILFNGKAIPVNSDGSTIVNFPSPDRLYQVSRSMWGLIQKSRKFQPSSLVNEGDVVLLIPQMYTGNTDFKMTPFGPTPGGFVIATIINSLLTDSWIRPLTGGEFFIIILTLIGALIPLNRSILGFWFGLMGTTLVFIGASFAVFVYFSILVPWLFPLIGLWGGGLTIFAHKSRASERRVEALKSALDGLVAPTDLKAMLKKPDAISFDTRERVVTLMFIDVVGFSLLAENMLPRLAFENLKKMLSQIGDTIHQFGGIIDKTLGDGLLCYFGYRFDMDSSTPNHAEQALKCGIAIQTENLKRNLEAAEVGEPVYPLRIGINTSSCYLGDLGSSSRIDFTVVGNGVNFAKRLEGASEMHSILMGATTYDLIKGPSVPAQAFIKRFIQIKHHSELVEAYEYDPFWDQTTMRAQALEAFRRCVNIGRDEQRWPVHDPSKIILLTNVGSGSLVNFSHQGFSVKLPRLLARGTRLNISIDDAAGQLKGLLSRDGVEVLLGEVRWSYTEGTEFVHGILISNLDKIQSDILIQYLIEFAYSHEAQKSKTKLKSPETPNDTKAS